MRELKLREDLSNILPSVNEVAVVGATPKEGKVGNVLLRNLINYGFKGKIYPVNPKYSEILGIKSYPTISSIPSVPDVVVVAVPAKVVPSVLREAERKGIKLAVVITAGFKEAGNKEAERALEEVIEKGRMRVIGPNSAGISVTNIRLHASIEVMPNEGNVGLAMQSGAMGGVVISRLRSLSSGVSFFVSIGNAADVGVEDAFQYALSDEKTEAMMAYVEWIKDGKKFVNVGKELSKRKPLCILKGGKGESSSRAIKTHTGGLAGSYEVFRAATLKAGAYLADDVDDLVEVCEVLRRLGDREVSRVIIVSNSGGLAIVTASQIEGSGVEIPVIPSKLRDKILTEVKKNYSGINPIDFGGDSFINQVVKTFTIEGIENYFDMGILVYVPTAAENASSMAETVKRFSKDFRLPVVAYFDGEGAPEVGNAVSKEIPIVTSSRNVGRALKALRFRHAFLKHIKN